jgi:putative ABC transport system permease protein
MPDWKTFIRVRLGAAGQQPDDDVVEELAQHAEAAFERACADGDRPDDALRRVEGLIEGWCVEPRALRRRPRRAPMIVPPATASSPCAGLGQDVRYSLRLLRRAPVHSLVALLTMALGIGATTTLFSVVSGVLMKPLPFPEADRLVRVVETRQGKQARTPWVVSNGTLLAWDDHPTTVEGVGAWRQNRRTLTGTGDALRLDVSPVTPNLFALLRVSPALGRAFVSGEGRIIPQGGPLILSYGLWQDRFGGRADILGHAIRLDDQSYTVVGVMPRGFAFPNPDVRAWLPMEVPTVVVEGGVRMSIMPALARLRPGVTAQQAAAEGTSRGRAAPDAGMTAMALFGAKGPVDIAVAPAQDVLTAEVRPIILILFAAVILLLATATANVASLQLVRATVRHRELAIRAAIGAGTGRLARQSLVESAVISLGGGFLGLLLSVVLIRALPLLLPAKFPRLEQVGVDAPVLGFALAVTVLTGLVCGLLPVWQSRRMSVTEALAEEGASPAGGVRRTRTMRARVLIMVFQVATACVLLVGSALLGRSLLALAQADRGYDPVNLLTAELPIGDAYPPERKSQIVVALFGRLRAIPGVVDAGIGNYLPYGRLGHSQGFTMASRRHSGQEIQGQALVRIVSPGYLDAFRARIIQGRTLAETDTITSLPVVLVNQTFASMYLGDHAVGERVPFRKVEGDNVESEVVGVVEDVRQNDVNTPRQPEVFVPYRQVAPDYAGQMVDPVSLVIRTVGDPAALVPTLRGLVKEQDRSLVLESIMTMEARVAASFASSRTLIVLLVTFSVLALLIAGVGLFGVLSYGVTQRVREIGVRMALGASQGRIACLVLGQALAITASGTAVGLLVSAALGKVVSRLLYGVTPYDPLSFGTVPLVLAVVAAAACVVPALRAARVDPIQALRGDG